MVNALKTRDSRRTSWKVAHACVRGSSHIRTGLPNQDSVLCTVRAAGASGPAVAIAAVSDGHGGARHFRSQIGSALAVSTALNAVQDFLTRLSADDGTPLSESAVQPLLRSLVDAWISSVKEDFAQHPFTGEELDKLEDPEARAAVEADPLLAYGATLLVAAATDSAMLYLQIGDGEILCVAPDGETARPLHADERLVGNQTTSLCQPEAWREFRAGWAAAPDLPALVLLSTDGYVNSFRSDEDFLQIGRDYLELLRSEGISSVAEELPQILEEATQQGSGDDITLAILQGELRGAGEMVPAPLRPAISDGSRSALIEQFKARHSSQNRRLEQLTAQLEETKRRNRMLRLVLIALVVAALSAAAYIFRERLVPAIARPQPILHPKSLLGEQKGTDHDKRTEHEKEKPAAGEKAAPVTAWDLIAADGKRMELEKKLALTESQVLGDGAAGRYLRVAADGGNLIVINDSQDTWKVESLPGKKTHKIPPGHSIVLKGAGDTVTFRKDAIGKIVPRGASDASHDHSRALPEPAP